LGAAEGNPRKRIDQRRACLKNFGNIAGRTNARCRRVDQMLAIASAKRAPAILFENVQSHRGPNVCL
jgi:hypothetical protein